MTTTLLVIDFINDIVHPNGKIAGPAQFIAENSVVATANQAITFCRNNKFPIIFIKIGFQADYLACPENSPVFAQAKALGALQLNTWGTEFHEQLDFQPNDYCLIKPRVSAFYATELEAILRAKKIDTLLITGVSTDMAVQLTAREAHDRDYKVIIVADACGAASHQLQENSLASLTKIAQVILSEQLR